MLVCGFYGQTGIKRWKIIVDSVDLNSEHHAAKTKGVRGASATRAERKKNANTTDKEQHHEEEPIQGVTHQKY